MEALPEVSPSLLPIEARALIHRRSKELPFLRWRDSHWRR